MYIRTCVHVVHTHQTRLINSHLNLGLHRCHPRGRTILPCPCHIKICIQELSILPFTFTIFSLILKQTKKKVFTKCDYNHWNVLKLKLKSVFSYTFLHLLFCCCNAMQCTFYARSKRNRCATWFKLQFKDDSIICVNWYRYHVGWTNGFWLIYARNLWRWFSSCLQVTVGTEDTITAGLWMSHGDSESSDDE